MVMLTESRIYSMHLQKRVNNGFKKKYWCICLLSNPGRQPTTVRKKNTESRGGDGGNAVNILCVQ